ncbi:MAG TPA: TonB-dependent receptor, partial [Thermoanaerobaculia bacterium]|nr:TonB-dependent receptor [Thermoanaerobaculia bacterium]
QPQNIINNCAALGVPVDLLQRNPQLSAVSAGNERLIPESSDNTSFGAVYGQGNWIVSFDFYDLEIEDAIQGRAPAEVLSACVETLDPILCEAVQRTSTGQVNLIDNQLQNIGGIEASGADFAFRWRIPTATLGTFNLGFDATYLDEFTELTRNPDGSVSENDRTGTITNETFQRAFPEWRGLSTLDWTYGRWSNGLVLRYVDAMVQESGNTLDSRVFTDVQARYLLPWRDDAVTFVLGSTNVLDEDPAVCDSCGVIGMSPVVHDLPGRVIYARVLVDVN